MNWYQRLKNRLWNSSSNDSRKATRILDMAIYFDASKCSLSDAWETVYQTTISDSELFGLQCVCEDKPYSVENIAEMIVASGMSDVLYLTFPQLKRSENSTPSIVIRGFTDGFGRVLVSGELIAQEEAILRLGRRLAEWSPVYYGRIFDRHFDQCQNLTDPGRYAIKGCDLAGLQMIKGDPVFGTIVDVSKNPGRVIQYSKYVEALGHVMWIRPSFWDLVGVTPIDPGQFHRHEWHDDVLTLVLRDSPFTCEDPGSNILNAARKSLFTVRWDGHIGRLYLGTVRPRRR